LAVFLRVGSIFATMYFCKVGSIFATMTCNSWFLCRKLSNYQTRQIWIFERVALFANQPYFRFYWTHFDFI